MEIIGNFFSLNICSGIVNIQTKQRSTIKNFKSVLLMRTTKETQIFDSLCWCLVERFHYFQTMRFGSVSTIFLIKIFFKNRPLDITTNAFLISLFVLKFVVYFIAQKDCNIKHRIRPWSNLEFTKFYEPNICLPNLFQMFPYRIDFKLFPHRIVFKIFPSESFLSEY